MTATHSAPSLSAPAVALPLALSVFTVTAPDDGGPQRSAVTETRAGRSRTRAYAAGLAATPAPLVGPRIVVSAAAPVSPAVVIPATVPLTPAPPVSVHSAAGSGRGGAVLAAAARFAGVPYVYGGASRAGVDCSGFTMLVFASLGVALPHNAAAQYYALPHIDASAVAPGDLIFLDGLGHVGIYAGLGLMWDAPVPGQSVGLHGIYGPFVAARG